MADGTEECTPAGDDQILLDKLDEVLSDYHLSPFGRLGVEKWIKLMGSDSDLSHAKTWLLHKLYRKVVIPPTLSQRGCPDIMPSLRAMPFWDHKSEPKLSWVSQLEKQYSVILSELLALRHCGESSFQPYRAPTWASDTKAADGVGSLSHQGGAWNVFYLQLHDMDFREHLAQCPRTAAFLATIPSLYQHSFFSAMAPQTHITPHHGPTNKKLRVHLPLLVPEGGGCWLEVCCVVVLCCVLRER